MADCTDWNDGVPPADMKDPLWIEGQWYERNDPLPWETTETEVPQTGDLF
jgi:hypothetical protein